MVDVHMRLPNATAVALKAAAAAQKISDAELVRRLLDRGLALETADAQTELLVAVFRRAIEPTKRMVYQARREAVKARYWARVAAIEGWELRQIATGQDHSDAALEAWKREMDDGASRHVRKALDERDPERLDQLAEEAAAVADELVMLTGEQAEPFEGQAAEDEGGDDEEET